MTRKVTIIVCACALVATAAMVFGWVHRPHSAAREPSAGQPTVRYWYDPMHPDEHFDKPGKSPFMDMALVPKYDEPTSASNAGTAVTAGGITIDSRVVENLGVRLASVEKGAFARTVAAVAVLSVDEHRIEVIQVRASGWVERLGVRAVGDAVRKGELLAGVYSPDLLATQQELLIAGDSQDPALIAAARRRLGLFGLADAQIARIEKAGKAERRVGYYAPFDGYVLELGVRQGAAVETGTTLFQLADSSNVWLIAEVPESQAAWLRTGDAATVDISALPGATFTGHVDYLYPELAQATRTLKARVVLPNPRQQLRPGMFARVQLQGHTLEDVLTIPTEAVIPTGTRSIVIVADDDHHFRPVLVRVGAEQEGRSEVLAGLHDGQRVVASGQFLIDSEASLRGAFDDLAGGR